MHRSGCILILEDEPFIALDLEYVLKDAGFNTRVCGSCAEAMQWLSCETPMAAVLDVELKDGPCAAVASILHVRNVPFVVHSGSTKSDIPKIFANGVWLEKPSDKVNMVQALRAAAEQSSMTLEVGHDAIA